MDHYTVVASLRRLDKKFTEELSEADRRAAFSKFKRVYAEEMAKLAGELTRRQKVQENLQQVDEQGRTKARELDEDLRRRMEQSALNREKLQQTQGKESKMLEENWRRKMDEIHRRNREQSKEAVRKAERLRREAEEFWVKKKSYTARETPKEDPPEPTFLPLPNNLPLPSNNYLNVPAGHYIAGGISKKEASLTNKTFNTARTEQKQIKFLLPDLKKVKLNSKVGESSAVSESAPEPSKKEVRAHLQRTERARREEEEWRFQKAMQKLEKIERTRVLAQERLEQEVREARRARELRESPEAHAARRQRSIEQLHAKSRKKLQQSPHSQSKELSVGRSRLSRSIEKHLETKKRIAEEEFNERESLYEAKQQKLRQGKMNRLIKEAINQIKAKTLNEKE